MGGKVVQFFPKWLANQEKRRKSLGFPTELWYFMHEQGYDPMKPEDREEFMKDLNDE